MRMAWSAGRLRRLSDTAASCAHWPQHAAIRVVPSRILSVRRPVPAPRLECDLTPQTARRMTASLPARNDIRIAVIGLGYVGLPLAAAFGRKYPTVGFDIDAARVEQLRRHHDQTLEMSEEELRASTGLAC